MQSGTGGNFCTFVRSKVLNWKTDANSLKLQHLLENPEKIVTIGKLIVSDK